MSKNTKTASKNKKCEHVYCTQKATRKVKVNGTGGWSETHYYCKQHADRLEEK